MPDGYGRCVGAAARWIEWRNEKWDGSLNRRATLEVLDDGPEGLWAWMPRGTLVERADASYAYPCDAVAFAPAGEHWQATWLFDHHTGLYVDLALPARLEGDRLVAVDLDLDVVRRRDGTVEVLDRDEFDDHRVRFGYPRDLVDRIEAVAADVADRVALGRPPFTVSPADGRLDRAIAERRAGSRLDDWVRAPNIAGDPDTYELENDAIARDGRLDAALHDIAPWDGRTLLDIGCGTGFWLPRYAELAETVVVNPNRRRPCGPR